MATLAFLMGLVFRPRIDEPSVFAIFFCKWGCASLDFISRRGHYGFLVPCAGFRHGHGHEHRRRAIFHGRSSEPLRPLCGAGAQLCAARCGRASHARSTSHPGVRRGKVPRTRGEGNGVYTDLFQPPGANAHASTAISSSATTASNSHSTTACPTRGLPSLAIGAARTATEDGYAEQRAWL